MCRKSLTMALAILISLFITIPFAYADAPFENYHVKYKDISKAILKNTVGVLTISNWEDKEGTVFKMYTKDGNKYSFESEIYVILETKPVSHFGYANPAKLNGGKQDNLITSYRYPILAVDGDYIQIAYNSIKDLRAWLYKKDLEESFECLTVVFNGIKKFTQATYFLDIFSFPPSTSCKIYKSPDNKSQFSVMKKKEPFEFPIVPMEQKGNFLRVAQYNVDMEKNTIGLKPLGWIKIKNDDGLIMIWLCDIEF